MKIIDEPVKFEAKSKIDTFNDNYEKKGGNVKVLLSYMSIFKTESKVVLVNLHLHN